MTDAAFYQLGPLREYLEDPTVFEIRINCFGVDRENGK